MTTFDLRCDRCSATASWQLPRPSMRLMLWDVAQHVGWRDVDGLMLCPAHLARPVEAPPPRQRIPWTAADLELMADMREKRATWVEIGVALSRRLGREITGAAAYQHWRSAWLGRLGNAA